MSSIRSVLIFSAFLIVLSTVSVITANSQDRASAELYTTLAEEVMAETKAIDDAREMYLMAAEADTTFLKANYEAGRLHLISIGKDKAVKYFQRVYRQDPDYRFDIEYSIGKSYQYGEKFDKAIEYFERYKQRLAKKPNYQGRDKVDPAVVERAIYECNNGKEYVANPGNFAIVNIGREINSEYEDYAPVLNESETELVFTTRRKDDNLNQNVADDNKPWEDIFIAKKNGDKWNYAKNIGEPVNTLTHNSNLALSADGGTLFIFNDDNGGDIYFSERDAKGVWSIPKPLPGIINSSFEEKSVTISSDEKTLYFSSNRPGGYGGLDIYKATKDNKGNWSNVKNLGPKINTEFDDDAPFIDYDGVTLYFSTKGRKGMGGYDVFKSTYNPNKNEWSEPENLGYPINTPDNDVYFVVSKDGKRAYYSSVREDGMGYTDIYMITIPDGIKNVEPVAKKEPEIKEPEKTEEPEEPVVVKAEPKVEPEPIVEKQPEVVKKDPEPVKEDPIKEEPKKVEPKKEEPKQPVVAEKPKTEPKPEIVPIQYIVKVVDGATREPLEAKVKLQGSKDNVLVGSVEKGTGEFHFAIKNAKASDYRLIVESDGYIFQNQTLKIEGATTQPKTLTRTVELRKVVVGASSILRNLYFDFDRATFKTESYTELNKLEGLLRQNASMIIEIAGHTDAVGTAAYNKLLSQKRAEAVKDFLVKKGIDSRRIKAVGYGKTRPLASNDDESEGRELNRRVEFKVLQK
jgi:outer membrane protein OmpA-like peptidoglycan-associated protein